MRRALVLSLLGLLCLAAAGPVLLGKVTRVVDGDTLIVQLSSGPIRVRLYGIDAPEHDQPGGREATAALTLLVGGARIELEPVSQDRYFRMVARVRRGRVDVNAEMVRQGKAWVYRRYLRAEDRDWCTLENAARRAHKGLWALDHPIPPWDFRHHIAGGVIPSCP